MNIKNNSGAIQGYTPTLPVQPQQAYPLQQPEQIQQYQQPIYQQYQQPVQQPTPIYQEEIAPSKKQGVNFLAFFKKRNLLLLISAIICTVWLLTSYSVIGSLLDTNQPGETAEELGAALGTAIGAALMIPFFIIAFIGQVFNWTGWLFNRRGLALTGAILYCVSLFIGASYGLGIVPCVVLSFIGYAQLKKKQKAIY